MCVCVCYAFLAVDALGLVVVGTISLSLYLSPAGANFRITPGECVEEILKLAPQADRYKLRDEPKHPHGG